MEGPRESMTYLVRMLSGLLGMILLSAFITADAHAKHRRRGPSSTPSATPSPAFQILEERGTFKDGRYIVPNEFDTTRYSEILRSRHGVLISVGTFRSLFDFYLGDFSRLVMIDKDSLTVGFNRWNLNVMQKLSASRTSVEQQRDTYVEILKNPDPAVYPEAEFKDPVFGTELVKTLGKKFKTPGIGQLKYALQQFYSAQYPSRQSYLYWGSNVGWEKVQKAIRDRQISTFEGSISGTRTMQTLAEDFRRRNETVGALDLSNILGYVEGTERVQLLKNLRALPWAENAVVLFTFKNFPFSRRAKKYLGNDREWFYFQLSATKFIQAIEKYFVGPQDSELTFMLHLAEDRLI